MRRSSRRRPRFRRLRVERGGRPAADEAPAETAGASEPETTVAEPATTEETGPPPLTAAEARWLKQIERYQKRFERQSTRFRFVTQTSMRRLARVFGDCQATLDEAGGPGRYEPAAKVVARACKRLARAERLLQQAMAVTDAGGAVVAGTAEEETFNRVFPAAMEASGNAQNDLLEALDRAREIQREIPSGR